LTTAGRLTRIRPACAIRNHATDPNSRGGDSADHRYCQFWNLRLILFHDHADIWRFSQRCQRETKESGGQYCTPQYSAAIGAIAPFNLIKKAAVKSADQRLRMWIDAENPRPERKRLGKVNVDAESIHRSTSVQRHVKNADKWFITVPATYALITSTVCRQRPDHSCFCTSRDRPFRSWQ
jgi:hypothetical protein